MSSRFDVGMIWSFDGRGDLARVLHRLQVKVRPGVPGTHEPWVTSSHNNSRFKSPALGSHGNTAYIGSVVHPCDSICAMSYERPWRNFDANERREKSNKVDLPGHPDNDIPPDPVFSTLSVPSASSPSWSASCPSSTTSKNIHKKNDDKHN